MRWQKVMKGFPREWIACCILVLFLVQPCAFPLYAQAVLWVSCSTPWPVKKSLWTKQLSSSLSKQLLYCPRVIKCEMYIVGFSIDTTVCVESSYFHFVFTGHGVPNVSVPCLWLLLRILAPSFHLQTQTFQQHGMISWAHLFECISIRGEDWSWSCTGNLVVMKFNWKVGSYEVAPETRWSWSWTGNLETAPETCCFEAAPETCWS